MANKVKHKWDKRKLVKVQFLITDDQYKQLGAVAQSHGDRPNIVARNLLLNTIRDELERINK